MGKRSREDAKVDEILDYLESFFQDEYNSEENITTVFYSTMEMRPFHNTAVYSYNKLEVTRLGFREEIESVFQKHNPDEGAIVPPGVTTGKTRDVVRYVDRIRMFHTDNPLRNYRSENGASIFGPAQVRVSVENKTDHFL